MELQAAATENDVRVVVLGHGSLEDAGKFHRHFPVPNLYVSEDLAAFYALPLHRGGLLDFVGPNALMNALPVAFKSLTRPGTIAAKIEQPLPGKGDLKQMGGQFFLGPGDVCHFAHVEQVPGGFLAKDQLMQSLGWSE